MGMVKASGGDVLLDLLLSLEDPKVQAAIAKMITLLKNMEESGLLDLLIAVTDPQVVEGLTRTFLTTGTLELADKAPELLDTLAGVVNALEKPVEPKSLTGLLSSLSDPAVARGLARMVEVLRVIGSR